MPRPRPRRTTPRRTRRTRPRSNSLRSSLGSSSLPRQVAVRSRPACRFWHRAESSGLQTAPPATAGLSFSGPGVRARMWTSASGITGAVSRSVIVVDRFRPESPQLRAVFDARFAAPREAHADRFVWDYWHVPDQYTALRTPAWTYFPRRLYAQFHNRLVAWGRSVLGCHDIRSEEHTSELQSR